MLLNSIEEKRVLFANTGIDSWDAPVVAQQIVQRIKAQETIIINKFDVEVINRIHAVLHTGRAFANPFMGHMAQGYSTTEIKVSDTNL